VTLNRITQQGAFISDTCATQAVSTGASGVLFVYVREHSAGLGESPPVATVGGLITQFELYQAT
jgi:hypothetical protein